MPKVPREIAGFVALPVRLRSSPYPKDARHYIYIKPHEPRLPDEDAARSLFLVNIPISTTEVHLRNLFTTQLAAGRIERVAFSENGTSKSAALVSTTGPSKKRKRQTADELEAALNIYHLPATFPSEIQASGAIAIVVFIDRPSMENGLKAARRATKSSSEIVWGAELDTRLPPNFTGLARYEAHKTLQFPPRASLLSIVDNYMTAFTAVENARATELSRKRAAPDEDGFITVTKGAKGVGLKKEEAEELKAKQKAKEQGLEDFYRFQMREKRKEQEGEFMRRFEEDKRRVDEMRRNRGAVRPEG